jgi:hypothetical protein
MMMQETIEKHKGTISKTTLEKTEANRSIEVLKE